MAISPNPLFATYSVYARNASIVQKMSPSNEQQAGLGSV